jgi:hypothetical protein
MFLCWQCCVLSGRVLCDGLITRPEESYQLWRVVVCDHETSKNKENKARYRAVWNKTTVGCNGKKTNKQRKICCEIIQISLPSIIFYFVNLSPTAKNTFTRRCTIQLSFSPMYEIIIYMYCSYNSWQLTAFYILYFTINYTDHTCKHFNALIVLGL